MLAERSVRRLSIRAPDAALARRAAFLIEDALRTASLPGDGGELVLLRRLSLPPFAATASPQQVAARLARACRATAAIDGAQATDAVLAAATAVRFADALTAHLALTRLILAGAERTAWCWPLLVSGYRSALNGGPALRAVALSLAVLPEAPVALPRWLELLLTHGEGACARLLLALAPGDPGILDAALGDAVAPSSGASPRAWRAALDWSLRQLGGDDSRHLWLARMARRSGLVTVSPAGAAALASRHADAAPAATASRVPDAALAADSGNTAAAADGRHDRRVAADGVAGGEQPHSPLPPAATGGADSGPAAADIAADIAGDEAEPAGAARRLSASADAARVAARSASGPVTAAATAAHRRVAAAGVAGSEQPRSAMPPAATGGADSGAAAADGAGDGSDLAGADRRRPESADAGVAAACPASAPVTAAAADEQIGQPAASEHRPLALPPAAGEPLAGTVAGGDGFVRRQATSAGGLLFVVPLLRGLGFAYWLAEDARRRDVPQRILFMLLRRLPIDGDDPIWRLFERPIVADAAADGEAARWLGDCRRHLRRRVGIGLHSLVCRPARLSLTPTHVDVWQDAEAVDLRLRRAGLDLDPGWVPWLGRVLCFHYRRGDR